MPPLRRRGADIRLLVRHFLDRFQRQYGLEHLSIDPRCLPLLEAYEWPGNVRELENLVHRQVLVADDSALFVIPGGLGDAVGPVSAGQPISTISFADAKAQAIASFERDYLVRLMHETNGNVTHAARRAAKERRALGKLLKKHGIKPLSGL
jgi:transcriptional regulator with GAF, ATPase, and Fis domain